MDPFIISHHAAALAPAHPELPILLDLLRNGDEGEIHGLCRLWISEGTPFVFSGEPMMYETVRAWIAYRLDIHPKEVTLIGSARIGYSLAPSPKLGKAFGSHSDLDLVAISEKLFYRFESEFQRFSDDLSSGELAPITPRKQELWLANIENFKSTSRRGFLDTWKVPCMKNYPLSSEIGQSCWLLCEKLRLSKHNYKVKKASLRVYRDFHSFVRQMRINLRNIV